MYLSLNFNIFSFRMHVYIWTRFLYMFHWYEWVRISIKIISMFMLSCIFIPWAINKNLKLEPGGLDAGDVIHGLPRWLSCDHQHFTTWPWHWWRHSVYHGDWVLTIAISPGGRPWRRWRHSQSTTNPYHTSYVTRDGTGDPELLPSAFHQVIMAPVTSFIVYHEP